MKASYSKSIIARETTIYTKFVFNQSHLRFRYEQIEMHNSKLQYSHWTLKRLMNSHYADDLYVHNIFCAYQFQRERFKDQDHLYDDA